MKICILVLAVGFSSGAFSSVKNGDADGNSLERYICHLQTSGNRGHNDNALVFFLKFIDFGCSTCLTNFLDFCDTLHAQSTRNGHRDIFFVFERDQNSEASQLRTLKSWARANNLNFPIHLAPRDLYEENGILRSSVLLMNKQKTIEYFEKIPLSSENQAIILKRLFGG